jgi:BirA family biotin operon repressor/biotin-[acetyl-CoA-carboxylase] ligase
MLSKTELQKKLRSNTIGRKLFVFEDIDSTNSCARALADAGTEEGAVVIAEFQSAGRGRQGRLWHAERGENLLLSILLRPVIPPSQFGFLPLFAATAAAAAVEEVTGLVVECKWPNDLLLNGKKFCGILVENSLAGGATSSAIIGIGMNVNQRSFPGDVADRATSLTVETGKPVDRVELLRLLLEFLDREYADLVSNGPGAVRKAWTRRSRMLGSMVAVQAGDTLIQGRAIRLAEDGGLVLADEAGERVVHAGDVILQPPKQQPHNNL